ncbi:haloacid dehalogenase type II [Effusibacillus consociatus]|uniref:Haloacid dehalogenase type II n=1 Tax=Effusibacillus consociatus TaxID=1117041 RepID=A0ABV9Q6U7_9BACL
MNQIKAIVFDAYGTLFDVHTVASRCEQFFPGFGQTISEIWRQKQLEYSWLRSLMGRYENFWHVTEDALGFALKSLGLNANEEVRAAVLEEYLRLKPYPEVPQALQALRHHKLAILSNGTPNMLNAAVTNAGLTDAFSSVISVDEVKSFKPLMGVYQLAPSKLHVRREEILFISSNAWDASGAKVFGFNVCWINRFGKTFEELHVEPDLTITGLDQLIEKL